MMKARRSTMRVPEYEPFFAHQLPAVPDLLQRLSWEHRQIEKLWGDLQRLHRHDGVRHEARLGDDSEAGIGQRLAEALADHEAAERAALYPAAARVMTPEWSSAATSEHAELRAALDEVAGSDPADEAVFATFEQIMARVLAHFQEEEQIVFPAMRVASPPGDLLNPEGYEFLGLPPGQAMLQANPGQRSRALGRDPDVCGMALDPGPTPVAPLADGSTEATPGNEETGNGETGDEETGHEATGTTKTRVKRLLGRR